VGGEGRRKGDLYERMVRGVKGSISEAETMKRESDQYYKNGCYPQEVGKEPVVPYKEDQEMRIKASPKKPSLAWTEHKKRIKKKKRSEGH